MTETSSTVLPFPPNVDEEQARRITAEANRLAGQSASERMFWARRSAERLGIEVSEMQAYVNAVVREREKQKKEQERAEQRTEKRAEKQRQQSEKQRVVTERADQQRRKAEQDAVDKAAKDKAKEKEKGLAEIAKLPVAYQEAKLVALASKLEEDLSSLRAELSELIDEERSSMVPATWSVEPWPDPVPTPALLDELVGKVGKHIAANQDELVTIALWTAMAWVHDAAAIYSPNLVLTSSNPDSGKTTVLTLLQYLTPKAVLCAEMTGPSLYRLVDREKPTMLADDVDDLFVRKPDLRTIFNIAWTKGARVPRVEKIGGFWTTVFFDPFCPKAVTMIGERLTSALRSRCIIIKLWPKKLDDKVVAFSLRDDDECSVLRMKLARWSKDNAAGLEVAQPLMPERFNNRVVCNWRLLLAIAELGGEAWAKAGRDAAERINRTRSEPSWQLLLLQTVARLKATGTTFVYSKFLVAELVRDATSPWTEYKGAHSTGKVTERQVAILLKGLDIFPTLCGPHRLSGYVMADFAKAFAHFPVSVPAERMRGSSGGTKRPSTKKVKTVKKARKVTIKRGLGKKPKSQ
jgi:hypothetical protein